MDGIKIVVTIIVVVIPIPAIIPKSFHIFISDNVSDKKINPITPPPITTPEPKRCKVSRMDTSILNPCFRFSKNPEIIRIQLLRPNKILIKREWIEIRFIASKKKL